MSKIIICPHANQVHNGSYPRKKIHSSIQKIKKLEFHPSHPSPFSIFMKGEGCEG